MMLRLETPRGGVAPTFPPAPAEVEKHGLRARVNQYKIKFQNFNIPELYVLKTYKQAVYVANFKSISFFLTHEGGYVLDRFTLQFFFLRPCAKAFSHSTRCKTSTYKVIAL